MLYSGNRHLFGSMLRAKSWRKNFSKLSLKVLADPVEQTGLWPLTTLHFSREIAPVSNLLFKRFRLDFFLSLNIMKFLLSRPHERLRQCWRMFLRKRSLWMEKCIVLPGLSVATRHDYATPCKSSRQNLWSSCGLCVL